MGGIEGGTVIFLTGNEPRLATCRKNHVFKVIIEFPALGIAGVTGGIYLIVSNNNNTSFTFPPSPVKKCGEHCDIQR